MADVHVVPQGDQWACELANLRQSELVVHGER